MKKEINKNRRSLCHIIIDDIPDEGLEELLQSVVDIHEFYSNRPDNNKQPKQKIERIQCEYGRSYDRPEFSFDEIEYE